MNKNNWSKLSGSDWVNLLFARPQLVEKCEWNSLDGHDWVRLIERYPSVAKICEWGKLTGRNWSLLLAYHPSFAEKCDWSKLDGQDIVDVIGKIPDLAKFCDMSKLNGDDWARLAGRQPRFLEKVEWQKLSTSDWVRLMTCYAEIVEKFESFTTVEGQTNAICEGINAIVQAAKRKARGYHTFEGYSAMIYLVAGKLDLATPTHFAISTKMGVAPQFSEQVNATSRTYLFRNK